MENADIDVEKELLSVPLISMVNLPLAYELEKIERGEEPRKDEIVPFEHIHLIEYCD